MSNNPETNIEDKSTSVINSIRKEHQEIERLRTEVSNLTVLVAVKKKKADSLYPSAKPYIIYIAQATDRRDFLNKTVRKQKSEISHTEKYLLDLKSQLAEMETELKGIRLELPKIKKTADSLIGPYEAAHKELQEFEKKLNEATDKLTIAENEFRRKQIAERSKKWFTSGSYAVIFFISITLFAVIAQFVPFYTLIIVIIGGLLALSIIGAFQLRNDEKISESSFLQLMLEAIKQIPQLKGIHKE